MDMNSKYLYSSRCCLDENSQNLIPYVFENNPFSAYMKIRFIDSPEIRAIMYQQRMDVKRSETEMVSHDDIVTD